MHIKKSVQRESNERGFFYVIMVLTLVDGIAGVKRLAGGIVFDIMRYSVRDGPGIRTTVFLKGCPLSCAWCHNPESRSAGVEMMLFPERCIDCGDCSRSCPNGVMTGPAGECDRCGSCAAVCQTGAREVAGRKMTAEKVMAEVERDIIFYDQSGGGVTFSGGEPLAQAGFLLELLAGCRERKIHATVDTTGYCPLDKLLQVSELTNLFLYDLKVMDQELHKRYTGVSNRLVLDNLRELASRRKNIVIRVPVIPGINDDRGNITDTGRFVSSLPGVNKVQILPYHRAGVEKYRRLGLEYNLSGLRPPGDALMDNIAVNLRKFGLEVQVGHKTNI